MKNLIVANYRQHGRVSEKLLRKFVCAQIENSLSIGWNPLDLVVVSNLAFSLPVTVINAPLNASCLTGSKIFALEYLFSQGHVKDGEVWWAHDLDAWQNYPFSQPDIADIGLTEYSLPKFNGGSVFLRPSAADIIGAVAQLIRQRGMEKEEPAIDVILRSTTNRKRVTVLNSTFNVGCSAFAIRYTRSEKPVLVSHFHPTGNTSWQTHVCGNNGCGMPSASPRLVELLARHFRNGLGPFVQSNKPEPAPIHYRIRESFHLGDVWARINYALRLLQEGYEFALYLPNSTTREVLDSLDIGPLTPKLLKDRPRPGNVSKALFKKIDMGDRAYRCMYFPTKVLHRPVGLRIGLALAANWRVAEKTPPWLPEMVNLLEQLAPLWSIVPIGRPAQMSVTEVVHTLSTVRFVVSIDNGIAHIARSVGVPLLIVQHEHPVSRGFPPKVSRHTLLTADNARAIIHEITSQILAENDNLL